MPTMFSFVHVFHLFARRDHLGHPSRSFEAYNTESLLRPETRPSNSAVNKR